MADIILTEIGKKLRLNLFQRDESVDPPVDTPLDVSGATVFLRYVIGKVNKNPTLERTMVIVDAPNGVVEYAFVSGDLDKPTSGFSEFGIFHFTTKITFPSGRILYSSEVQRLSVRDTI